MTSRLSFVCTSSLIALGSFLFACSGVSGGSTEFHPATGGAAGSSIDSGTPTPDAFSGTDSAFFVDASIQDQALSTDTACATAKAEATVVPLDIYLMLDKTASMGSDCSVGSDKDSKWCRAINSIAGFVSDPSSAGTRLALDFFSGGSCGWEEYAQPAVALGLLEGNAGGHAATIITALNNQKPSGTTPTEPAILGLNAFTKQNAVTNRVMIGILVTDGDPTECNGRADYLGGLLRAHFNETGIRTFVVGMGDGVDFDWIEAVASQGGTPTHDNYCHSTKPCHHFDVGDGNPQAFIDSLKTIQKTAIGCQFTMPTSTEGTVDPEQVRVQYTPHGTDPTREIGRVESVDQCPGGGWYYQFDAEGKPTTVILCPETCEMVSKDETAKVEILLGCLGPKPR